MKSKRLFLLFCILQVGHTKSYQGQRNWKCKRCKCTQVSLEKAIENPPVFSLIRFFCNCAPHHFSTLLQPWCGKYSGAQVLISKRVLSTFQDGCLAPIAQNWRVPMHLWHLFQRRPWVVDEEGREDARWEEKKALSMSGSTTDLK